MKYAPVVFCLLILYSAQSVTANLSNEHVTQILAEAAAYPENATYLALAYPELTEEIIKSAQKNPNNLRIRARNAIYPEKSKAAIAKERQWRAYTCLEKYSGEYDLRSETEYPWPDLCSKWVTDYSENPATTNSAQNKANAYANAFSENKITYEQAQEGIEEIIDSGSQIVDPLAPSGS